MSTDSNDKRTLAFHLNAGMGSSSIEEAKS
uniref:Uncharacterized protein n=1 Tax=Anguilla anguilla TaxID=7936 RepID=A0A0E9QIA3_ANGAN